MKIIKESSRVSLKKALETINKNDFEKDYHNINNTLKDLSLKYGISVNLINSLLDYWGLKWSPEEITLRKQLNSTKYDRNKAYEIRNSTNLERYKSKNPRSVLYPDSYVYDDEKIKSSNEKRVSTNRERYNVDYYSQTPEWKETAIPAAEDTMEKKYGVKHYAQTPEFHKKSKKLYFYDNQYFDSSWELYYYIFQKENGHNIKRNNEIYYEYTTESDQKKHRYFPDFIDNDQVVEVKGSQYLDHDGHLINIYSDDQEKSIAKDNCMINNGVRLIQPSQLKNIIRDLKSKYGKAFIKKYIVIK